MIWHDHSDLKDKHAFLGGSKSSWQHYESEEELFAKYKSHYAALLGTALHDIASSHIILGYKLRKNDEHSILYELAKMGIPRNVIDIDYIFPNLYNFVNDGIGFRMQSEQGLKYSENCYGCSDAISFDDQTNFLRIHDLKTGTAPTHMEQLDAYTAMFCLEYQKNPNEIRVEERIYQGGEIIYSNPEPELIISLMDKIIEFDKMFNRFKKEGR